MAYTTIDDPSAHFQVKIYTGTGSSQAFTFDGNSDLQPDLMWVKSRTNAYSHYIYDSTRGTTKRLLTDTNAAEGTLAEGLTAFGSDGFTLGSDDGANESSDAHVGFGWKANGGTTSSVTESGSRLATTYQANTTAGFSIMTYTGNAQAGDYITHGLGAVPHLVIVKISASSGSTSASWGVYHHKNTAAPETDRLKLNDTSATADDAIFWNDTAPTSTVVTLGTYDEHNENDSTYVGYAWTEIQGYSKFGSYTGNADANGPFVYTGFKPAFVMVKDSTNTGSWTIFDKERGAGTGVNDKTVKANSDDAEYTSENWIGFVSNGFKLEGTNDDANGSSTYVYMAFAEQPFVTSGGVPATAR